MAVDQNEVVEPDDVAQVLADCLAKIVPPGFHVHAANGMIWYSSDPGRFPGQQSDFHAGGAGVPVRDNIRCYDSIEEGIVGIAEQALGTLQEYVDEATHEPWPGTIRPPRPHAEIHKSALVMWYEDRNEIVLSCDPIPLPDMDMD